MISRLALVLLLLTPSCAFQRECLEDSDCNANDRCNDVGACVEKDESSASAEQDDDEARSSDDGADDDEARSSDDDADDDEARSSDDGADDDGADDDAEHDPEPASPGDEAPTDDSSTDDGASEPALGTLCDQSCRAGIEACSYNDSELPACVATCEDIDAVQPSDCLAAWEELLTCQTGLGAWRCDDFSLAAGHDHPGLSGGAYAAGCEERQRAHLACLWDGGHCGALGGEESALGACGIPCTNDAECPIGSSRCFKVCIPNTDDGCGPEGWKEEPWGCQMLCTEEGNDSDCPSGMHCWDDSTGGDYSFCGN